MIPQSPCLSDFRAGDPSTPGYPAYENATRVDAGNLPKIPSLPVSWANAERLLAEISGDDALELTGRASKRNVKLVNHGKRTVSFDVYITSLTAPIVVDKVSPIWNTVGVIPGHIKNETVLIGGHRDGEPWAHAYLSPVSDVWRQLG